MEEVMEESLHFAERIAKCKLTCRRPKFGFQTATFLGYGTSLIDPGKLNLND